VFLLPRIQLCSLHRLSWLLLPYDYRHDYVLVSSTLKLSSLKSSKYTRWIFASIGRFVTKLSYLSEPRHVRRIRNYYLAVLNMTRSPDRDPTGF